MNLGPHKLVALKQAIEHIAYDNGAINRFRTREQVMCNVWFALRQRYTLAQLGEIEEDLLTLSPTLLEEVCIGELLDPMPIKDLTHEALNHVFENLS